MVRRHSFFTLGAFIAVALSAVQAEAQSATIRHCQNKETSDLRQLAKGECSPEERVVFIGNNRLPKVLRELEAKLGAKADKLAVDALGAQVRGFQNQVNGLSAGSTQTQSSVNAIAGRVGNLESSRATKDELNAAKAGLESQIAARATSQQLNATKAELEGLIATRATQASVTAGLAAKADTSFVNATKADLETQISARATEASVASRLSGKADKSEVTAGLAAKADTSFVNQQLGLKADKTELTTGLAGKVDNARMGGLAANLTVKGEVDRLDGRINGLDSKVGPAVLGFPNLSAFIQSVRDGTSAEIVALKTRTSSLETRAGSIETSLASRAGSLEQRATELELRAERLEKRNEITGPNLDAQVYRWDPGISTGSLGTGHPSFPCLQTGTQAGRFDSTQPAAIVPGANNGLIFNVPASGVYMVNINGQNIGDDGGGRVRFKIGGSDVWPEVTATVTGNSASFTLSTLVEVRAVHGLRQIKMIRDCNSTSSFTPSERIYGISIHRVG